MAQAPWDNSETKHSSCNGEKNESNNYNMVKNNYIS